MSGIEGSLKFGKMCAEVKPSLIDLKLPRGQQGASASSLND
jgi:hypothetical protein